MKIHFGLYTIVHICNIDICHKESDISKGLLAYNISNRLYITDRELNKSAPILLQWHRLLIIIILVSLRGSVDETHKKK